MDLKNYTSTIPADRSISRIEKLLVSIGATNINKEYDSSKMLKSITFLINVNNNTRPFKLPARVDVVEELFRKEVKRPQPGTLERIAAQAERTAWKIIHDWVEVQVSMIKLEQAEFTQVFLPYAYDVSTNETFYDKLKASGFKALNQ
jgi:hypothetical protein